MTSAAAATADPAHLQAVITHAPIVLFEIDGAGRFTLSEGSALATLGLRPGEVVGQSLFDLYAGQPDILEKAQQALGGKAVSGIATVQERTFKVCYTPILDHAGTVERVVGVAYDVTELQRLAKAYADSEARLLDFVQASSDWLWETDAEHRFIAISGRLKEILGFDPELFLGRRRWEVAEPIDPQADLEAHKRALKRHEPFRDLVYSLRDGNERRRVIQVSGRPLFGPKGEFRGYRGTGREISREIEAREQLRESEQRFRSLMQNMRNIVFCRGAAGSNADGYDDEGVRVYGKDAQAINGCVDAHGRSDLERWYAAIHPDDRAVYHAAEQKRKQQHVSYTLEFRINHPLTGELRWLRKVAWVVDDQEAARTYFDSYIIDITEQKQVELALRESEGRFRSLLDNMRNIIFCRGRAGAGAYGYADGTAALYGADVQRMAGTLDPVGNARITAWYDAIHPDHQEVYREAERRRKEHHEPYTLDYRIYHPGSGELRWMREVAWVVEDAGTGRTYFDSYILDVTDEKHAAQALKESEERYRRLVEEAPIAILIYREQRCTYANPVALDLLGAQSCPDLLSWQLSDLAGSASQDLLSDLVAAAAAQGSAAPRELRCRRLDGRHIVVEVRAAAITEAGEPAIQLVLVDLTARKRAEAGMRHMAHHDALTGLPNRLLLMERLSQAISSAQRNRQRLALMILDLDGFKEVNDALGHAAGDELLRLVAQRLRRTIRRSDTVARLGGDEFAIIQTGLDENRSAATLAGKIVDALNAPFRIDHQEVRAGTSIGISLYPADGIDAGALMQHADLALYRAKDAGRNRFCFFEPSLNAAAHARRQIAGGLRAALTSGALRLAFQPQIDIRHRKLVGAEALLRWQHPTQGDIAPTAFIPVAEATGLIRPMGRSALDQACTQARAWQDQGRRLSVAVNVSAAQLRDPGFEAFVKATLARHQLDASLLCLEVTESLLIEPQIDSIGALLNRLASLGVRIAIDDFGTGYSSLLNLKRLPVHHIKIDQSFVRGIGSDAESEAIIQATVSLSHSLGKCVIAEGVENETQHRFLVELGCDQAQGYLYGPPGPADSIFMVAPSFAATER